MKVLSAVMAGLTSLCAFAGGPPEGQAWVQAPALTADPSELLRASLAHPVKESVAVVELLEESKITLDAEGRRELHYRYVFRVDQESAVEGWGAVSWTWEPWHQARPELRARVIRPDGKVYVLDPATVGEFPVAEGDARIYDDRKRLSAPLPQLCVGAVAEVECISRETQPTFKVGTLGSVPLHQPVPVLRTLVSLEAPESMPLHWKVRGLKDLRPVRTTSQGRVRLLLDLGPMEPQTAPEPHANPEAKPQPVFLWSTVPTWAAAASHYTGVVDRQLQGAALEAWSAKALEGATSPQDKIQRLLARLNKDIRYTGLEFGEGSVVPRKPGEVLGAGYGDCKDKASLLVALLRGAGIPASVALLNTGPGQDVDPDVPGMNHFDHAIVYVPGPKPMWIDPTVERARAGELPFTDQGRWALVADPGTTALLRTPEVEAAGNLTLETREVYLADSGKARIKEISTPSGLAELSMRYEFRSTDPKSLKENLKKYVQGAYSAEEVGVYKLGDAADLDHPFTLELEALGAGIAETTDVDASVTLNVWAMGGRLRQLVPTSYDRSSKEPEPARKSELLWSEPYAMEWRYRIHPPTGFVARPLPENNRLNFGPAWLSRTFAAAPDGTVTATFHFESGKRRWSPEEVEAARTAMEAFGKSAPTRIGFDQEGEAHLAADRFKEAIQSFRRLAALQPTKGTPHSRLALALLRAGLGDAAREEARKACQMEPTAMFTHRTLGWVLLHDPFNRAYHAGWDYEGAVAAFRKAKAVDPKDRLTRLNLAILLEHNPEGERYGKGARLDLALQEYEGLRKDLHAEDLNVNVLIVQMRASKFAEAQAFAKSLPPSEELAPWPLAAIAAGKGAEAALKEAESIQDVVQRRKALLGAADILVPVRKYAEASALLVAGADGASNAPQIRSRAAILAKTRRHEDFFKSLKGPEAVVWRFLRAALDPQTSGAEVVKHFSAGLQPAFRNETSLKEMKEAVSSATETFRSQGISTEVALDVALALTQVNTEKTESGAVKVHFQAPSPSGERNSTYWVMKEKGGDVIAATDDVLPTFGFQALYLLDQGDLVGVKALLDGAREKAWAGGGDDPLAGQPFCRFWTMGQEATPQQMRWAAAALLAGSPESTDAIPMLKEGRAQASDEATRQKFDMALLAAAAMRRDWKELEAATSTLEKAYPESKMLIMSRSMGLFGMKRGEEMLSLAEKALKRVPRDPDFLEMRASALAVLGRSAEKEGALLSSIERGTASASDFNNLAWAQFARGAATEQTLDYARRSLQLRADSTATQHTLACVLAVRGEVKEAMELFFKGIGGGEEAGIRDQDWFLLGSIAEQLGETDAALACYRRLSAPKEGDLETDSCFSIASKRIQAIAGPRAAGKS